MIIFGRFTLAKVTLIKIKINSFHTGSSASSGVSSAAGSFSAIASVSHTLSGKKPLKDMLFHVIGTSLKKDVVKTIRRLGGKGSRSPNNKVAACITTKGIYTYLINHFLVVVWGFYVFRYSTLLRLYWSCDQPFQRN